MTFKRLDEIFFGKIGIYRNIFFKKLDLNNNLKNAILFYKIYFTVYGLHRDVPVAWKLRLTK